MSLNPLDETSAGQEGVEATTESTVVAVVHLKVRRPHVGSAVLPRDRLFRMLEDAARCRCTVVSAGAGFGKTVLLSSWAARHVESEPVAWLSLDPSDTDPQRLCAHLLAALQEALRPRPAPSGSGFGVRSAGERRGPGTVPGRQEVSGLLALRAPPAPSPTFLLDALIPALQDLDAPMVLVVDDVHHLATSPGALSILDTLLRWAPPQFRLVLAGRSEPALALSRLRLNGQLTVLREDQLCFTPEESTAVLVREGLDLPSESQRSLQQLTGGWPAAVRLAALSLTELGIASAALEGNLAKDLAFADYLTTEVLDGLPGELVSFVLRATVDDLVSPDLVNHVTGGVDGAALLEACERRNLFLTRADAGDGEEWYSWHQLFATSIRRRFRAAEPAAAREAHLAAADWWRTRDPVRAVEHATEARSRTLGVEILAQTWPALALRGESRTLLSLTDLVPGDTDDEAEVRLAACYARVLDGDHRAASRQLALACASRERLPSALRRRFDARAAWLRLSLVEQRTALEEVLREARRLVEDPRTRAELTEVDYALACLAVGVGQTRLQRDPETATWTLEAAEAAGRAAGLDVLVLAAKAERCLALIAQGNEATIERYAADLVEEASRRGWGNLGPLALPLWVLGWLAWWRGDPMAASVAMDRAGACCPRTDWSLRGLISYFHGLSSLALGDLEAAEHDLAEARTLAVAGCLPPWADSLLAGFGAEVAAARGDLSGALQLVTDGPRPEYRLTPCTRADLLRRGGDPSGSLAALDELEPEPYDHIRTHEGVLRSLAFDALGKEDEAADALEAALAAAAPARLAGPFLWHPSEMARLLDRQLRRGTAHEAFAVQLAQRLTAAAQPDAGRSPRLTPQETKVLQYLRSSMSNAEIAEELFLSVNTVKTHAASVYRKLGVEGRRQAVRRAQELGLFTTR